MDHQRLPRSSVLAVVAVSFLLASDAAAVVPRYTTVPSGAQVVLGTAATEAFKSVSPVGLDATVTVGAGGKLQVGTRKFGPITLMRGVPGAKYVNAFDTDLGPEITRIAFDPIVVMTTETDQKGVLTPAPGKLKLPDVTFTASRPSPTLRDWMRGVLAGTAVARDVTVNIKSSAGAIVRTFVLRGALPTSYSGEPGSTQITLRPQSLDVRGATSPAWTEWVRGTLFGTFPQKDLKITWASTPAAPVTLKGAFLTEYRFTALDASSEAPLEETLVVQFTQSDPLP